jgi:hypothetical protein
MQREAYLCTEEDLPDLIRLVKKHQYIYGVDTVATGLQRRTLNLIEKIFLEKTNIHIVGVRSAEKRLLSFCAMIFWESIPAWSPLFLYEDSDQLFPKFRIQQPLNFNTAMQKCIEIAESKNIYTGFLVTRFSYTLKRINDEILKEFPEYMVSEVEILEPYTKSKYLGFKMLLGGMDGLNEKTIVVIQFSKSKIVYN